MVRKTATYSHDADLTGLWSGEYWYNGAGFPTPFTAHFEDASGTLSGTTLEPNTFADPGLTELSAAIRGSRGDLSVRFTKVYDAAPGAHQHPIYYKGAIDAAFTMIDGEWSFGAGSGDTGRFVLVRVSRGAEAAAASRLAEIELKR